MWPLGSRKVKQQVLANWAPQAGGRDCKTPHFSPGLGLGLGRRKHILAFICKSPNQFGFGSCKEVVGPKGGTLAQGKAWLGPMKGSVKSHSVFERVVLDRVAKTKPRETAHLGFFGVATHFLSSWAAHSGRPPEW